MELHVSGRKIAQSILRRKAILLLTVLFVISRACAYFIGLRFNTISLTDFQQMVDPVLLRNELMKSLWYLHSQPPLFNFYAGSLLKLGNEPYFFALSFHLLGLLMTIVLYTTLREFKLSAPVSFIFALFFALTPSSILYEYWLFYTYPVTGFLMFAILFLFRALNRGKRMDYFYFACCIAIVALIVSFFHLVVWVAAIFLALLLIRNGERKKILAAVCLPFLAVLFVYTKNFYLFNSFSASTWFGMNISRISTFQLPYRIREKLTTEGTLSSLALIAPFSKPFKYDDFLMQSRGTTVYPASHAAVLDSRFKSNGMVNYNWIGYIEISRAYGNDAGYVLRHLPSAYLKGIKKAAAIYFLPSSNYHRLDDNRERISTVDGFVNRWICGALFAKEDRLKMREQLKYYGKQNNSERSWFLIFGYPLLFFYGTWLSFQKNHPARGCYLFLCFSIAYVTLVSICFEVGENNRFRFYTEPYVLILLATFTDQFMNLIRRRSTNFNFAFHNRTIE